MTFPSVVGSPGTTANGLGTSVALTMPSSIVAGRLLLLLVYAGRAAGTPFTVSGWTQIGSHQLSSNSLEAAACYAKVAVGSDTATWGSGDGSSRGVAAQCYQIDGWSGVLADVRCAGASGAAGAAAPDSPNLAAASTADTMWFALGAGAGTPTMTAPTNYTNLTNTLLGFSTLTMSVARRDLNAASENPAAFTGSLSRSVALTVSVPPSTVQAGALAMAASSALTLAGVPDRPAALAMAATATLSAAGVPNRPAELALAAASALTVGAARVAPAALAMVADSTLTAAGTLSGPGADFTATATLTIGGVGSTAAALAMAADSTLTVDSAGDTAGALDLTAGSTLTLAGVPVRQAALALSGSATLIISDVGASRLGALVMAATASLTVTGTAPTFAPLKFQDMEATVTPPSGYLEPLPLTLGPNSRPGDVRMALVQAQASAGNAGQMIQMTPDPPDGFSTAYARSLGAETKGVYFRRQQNGDEDTSVAWRKPSGWRYFNWALLSVRGVDPAVDPIAGRLTLAHKRKNAFATASSVTVPGRGVMLLLVGTVPDPEGAYPAWATPIGIPTDWSHLVATDKSGDKFYSFDTNPALTIVARKYETAGTTGTVTFPTGVGGPALAGMWVFLRAAPDVISTGSPITATASMAAGSSSSGTAPHSVGAPITSGASMGPAFNPLHGSITQTYRLPGRQVEASRIQWASVGDVTVETSINSGLSWDLAENWRPIPRLRDGDSTTRTVLVRATLTRASTGDPKPRLKWLKVRVGCRKTTDELLPTFFGSVDKTKTKITAGNSGGSGGSTGGAGAFARGGGLLGAGAVVKVHATDVSRLIKAAKWPQPYTGPTGYTYAELGRAMVLDRRPSQRLFSQVSSNHTLDDSLVIWGLDQGGDPWQDIRGVYTAIGHECFFDVGRAFVSRPVPDPRRGPVVWNFDHTVRPVMIGLESELDTSQIVNGWVIKGESTTSTNPVSAWAFNLDPSNRYNAYDPPIGIGQRFERLTFPLAKTQAQCQDIANGALNNSLGLANTVKIGIVAHPGIVTGDIASINSPETGVVGRFLVQGYELPDSPVEQMPLTCFRQTVNA